MARRDDTAGRGRRRRAGGRGSTGPRLGVLAALAVLLPVAPAAPAAAAQFSAAQSSVVEFAVADGVGEQRVEEERAGAAALPGPKAGAAGHSPRLYYSTWRDARTYWSQDSRYPTGGWLWTGRHYFFCQVEGEPHSDGEGYSTWWALTDDHTGNQDVFVSATAFRTHEPWQPIEGLPRC